MSDPIDNIQLPEEFLEPVAKRKLAVNSTFMITINSNKSAVTMSRDDFARVGKKLIFAAMKTRDAFSKGLLLKPMPSQDKRSWRAPKLTYIDWGLERNNRAQLAHIHIFCEFNGGCHIDQASYRQMIQHLMRPECSNVHVNIKGATDTSALRKKYLKKNYNDQESTTNQVTVQGQSTSLPSNDVPQLPLREDNLHQ